MTAVVRVIIENEPRSGRWNMAIDEALLESALDRNICTLRWYRWSEATLSLGYFQKPGTFQVPDLLSKLPVVRRLTGGGAIVHHREWTYSCAVPKSSALSGDPGGLYGLMHGVMIDALRKRSVEAALRGSAAAHDGKDFLCYTRGDANDVVLSGHKIIGSAQRRRRGAILQHGSLLWRASDHAPHLPGVCDLADASIDADEAVVEMAEGMAEGMAKLLGGESDRGALTDEEMQRAAEILERD